jgi:uncharacterized membrane protein YraQ (UPF0718 family)
VTEKGKKGDMLIPTIVMGVLAFALLLIGYLKGQQQHVQGLREGAVLTVQVLPMLVFAFIIAGMIQVLIPRELISKWIGAESGWRGIMIGAIAGGLAPGGPYINLPVVAALMRAGASVATGVAFLTGWLVWSVTRLPMEVGILGWRFTLIRLACTFFFPPLAGFLAQILFSSPR